MRDGVKTYGVGTAQIIVNALQTECSVATARVDQSGIEACCYASLEQKRCGGIGVGCGCAGSY